MCHTEPVAEPRDLGLFPLDLVALPGEGVPLHLFEPRYRQLFADCVLENRPFVLVRTGPHGTDDVGCALTFRALVRRYADGRLNAVCIGESPVEILEETEGHLYFSALVRPLADTPSTPDPAVREDVLTRYRGLAGLRPGEAPQLPKSLPLSYGLAGALNLEADAKQALLESREEAERLQMLARILRRVEVQARHPRLATRRAQANGKVSAP